MRTQNFYLAIVLFASITFGVIAQVHAVPITGGTGPGGIGQLSVSGNVTGAGPLVWLDADDISQTSGTKVLTWSDSSTNGNDATADAGSLNTYQVGVRNGRPAVRLPGAVNAREFTLGSSITGRTWISAMQVDDTFNCCDGLFGQVGSDSGLRTFNDGSAAWQVTGGSVGNAGVDVNGTGLNAYTELDWQTVTALSGGAGTTLTAPGIGQYFSTGDREIHGYLGEVAIYEQTLNTAQRQILNSYHAAKYALTSPAVVNDRYDGDTPGNGDYDLDVFGIGRVDGSNIFDNTGSNGLGFEDSGSTLADGDFLLAGHNVEANSLTELGVPAGEAMRMQRVWYVDRTNAAGLLVDMSFDFSDAGIGAIGIESASLLFSSIDSPFSFSTVGVLNTSIVDDTVTFELAAGALVDGYYTVAFTQIVPEPTSFLLLGFGALGLLRHTRRRRRMS